MHTFLPIWHVTFNGEDLGLIEARNRGDLVRILARRFFRFADYGYAVSAAHNAYRIED